MNKRESAVHKRARFVGRRRRKYEAESILILQEVDQLKLWKKLGIKNLYRFALEEMEFDEAPALKYINVARKALIFPELHVAIQNRTLSVTKADRIVGAMTKANAKSLIDFAVTHTVQQINREVARINPKEGGKNCDRHLSPDWVEITRTIPIKLYDDMRRAEDVHGLTSIETMARVYHEHLERNDPLRKAKRALEKGKITEPTKEEVCLNRITANIAHAVNMKDEGRCTHIGKNGVRCPDRRFLDFHHVIYKSQGGNNHPTNLTTLCGFHHRLVHGKANLVDST